MVVRLHCYVWLPEGTWSCIYEITMHRANAWNVTLHSPMKTDWPCKQLQRLKSWSTGNGVLSSVQHIQHTNTKLCVISFLCLFSIENWKLVRLRGSCKQENGTVSLYWKNKVTLYVVTMSTLFLGHVQCISSHGQSVPRLVILSKFR